MRAARDLGLDLSHRSTPRARARARHARARRNRRDASQRLRPRPPTQIAMRATLLLSIAASALAETKSYAAAHAAHVRTFQRNSLRAGARAAERRDLQLIAITTHRYKTWRSVPLVVREHIIFGKQLGNYLGSYVGPRALEPRLNEAIMNTMRSVNTCPYCTGLHGELGRMAGINSYAIVEGGAGEAAKQVSSPAIAYTMIVRRGLRARAGGGVDARRVRGGDGRGQDEVGRGVLLVPRSGARRRQHRQQGAQRALQAVDPVQGLARRASPRSSTTRRSSSSSASSTPCSKSSRACRSGSRRRSASCSGRSSGCTSCRSPCSAPPSPSRRCRSPTFSRAERGDATLGRRLAFFPPLFRSRRRVSAHSTVAILPAAGSCRSRFAASTVIFI